MQDGTVIKVTGAGTPECNGDYAPSERKSDDGKHTIYEKGEMTLCRSHCTGVLRSPSDGTYNNDSWVLNGADGHRRYHMDDSADNETVPTTGWTVPSNGHNLGQLPAPTLAVATRRPLRLKHDALDLARRLADDGAAAGPRQPPQPDAAPAPASLVSVFAGQLQEEEVSPRCPACCDSDWVQ